VKILSIHLTKSQKKLLENFTSLSFLQAANYILPFITVPYLVRVLGPEKFGLIAFAQAFIQYFVILTDYGFNLSATRRISIFREDEKKVSIIFSSVFIIKTSFLLISFLLMCVVVFLFPKFNIDWRIYFISFGIVLGNVLFPVWFFQGMEKMKYIAFLNILTKSMFTMAIFIFVREQSDYLNVPLLRSLGFIIAGILSLRIIWKYFRVKLVLPKINFIIEELKEGFHIFISTLAISLYTISNIFILGLFTNNIIVGYYSAGEKIIKAFQALLTPLYQTTYPHISKLASESKELALNFVRKMIKLVGIPTFIISSGLLIFAPQINNLILGDKFKSSVPVIQILSFILFIVAMSNVFAIQGLYGLGRYKEVMRFVSICSLIYLPVVSLFTYLFSYIGTAISYLLIEISITLLSLYYFRKLFHPKKVLAFNYENQKKY